MLTLEATAQTRTRREAVDEPRVLFAHPATLHFDVDLPPGSRRLGREAADVRSFGLKYGDPWAGVLIGLKYARDLWRQGADCDVLVSGRSGQLYAAMRGLLPLGRRPHLLLDVEWLHRHGRRWRRWLSVLDHRLIARGAWKIQVFCEAEAATYAEYYGIDPKKFVWLPYCTDIKPGSYAVEDGDYLFTGGSQNRDYETLGHAVAGLGVEVRVAAPPAKVEALPDDVRRLGTTSRDVFWSEAAGARAVVLALDPDVMRCPGVITYVTAMRLGKCVVVNDPRGAPSYIRHGETGLIVAPRDPAALRDALLAVLTDDSLRRRLAENARAYAAEHFTAERYRADFAALLRGWRGGR
jgi:glycosyltransferase involved in cell wall biosynthesis